MVVEFDHLFICTEIGAAAADRLRSLGLMEGSSRTHPGQGTANRRFFFHNAMVELLWVHDPAEAQSEPIQRTRLWERWAQRQEGACPFGLCFRSTAGATAFSSWAYRPPYLPETLSIAVGTNSEVLTEPMLFQIPFGQRPDRFPPEQAQPLEHPIGWREITRVEVVSPAGDHSSPELQAVVDAQQIKLRVGPAYCLELGFDGESQGQQIDCEPELPLILSW
jgi:Glyoxalase-like domain